MEENYSSILIGVQIYREYGGDLIINHIKERESSTMVSINKGDSLPWLQENEVKRKTELQQAIVLGLLLFGILLVLLTGFYLRSII